MGRELLEKIFHNWTKTYYTIPFWYCCSLFALIVGIQNYRRERIYFFFILYTLATLICLVIWDCSNAQIINNSKKLITLETVNTLFTILEISIFAYFFNAVINSKYAKIFLRISVITVYTLSSIFFILTFTSQLTNVNVLAFSYLVNISEFILLLLLCLVYFYELFDQNRQLPAFKKTASFLIVVGLFFYTLISFPFLLIGDKLLSYSKGLFYAMFSMHYISIGILFICLAKAFKCKTSLTT